MKIVTKHYKSGSRRSYESICKECNKIIHIDVKRADKLGWRELCAKCSQFKLGKSSKIYQFNENYFSERSLQSCYWAGFIAADGCVNERNCLSIDLQASDEDHIALFLNAIDSNHVIREGHNGKSKRVFIYSEKIVNDLAEIYNITPRKSKTLIPPNLTNEDEIKAFIIGYIDGDGCITSNGKYMYLKIIGTRSFNEWVKNWFEMWIPVKRKYDGIRNASNVTMLQVGGNRAEVILKMLDGLPIEKLGRKWEKINTIKLYKNHSIVVSCNLCCLNSL